MNDEQRLLASAVLDDAATTDEQTRAGADPEVRAEIERLRAVRDRLRAGGEPDPARREASIAAALAAFDVGDRVAAPPPPSLDARRRARWLAPMAAAAALVIIVVGAVIAGGDDEGGDDAAAPAATELAPAAAVDRDATAGVEEAATASTAGEASAGAAPPSPSDLTASDQLVATAPATAEVLRTPDELAAFARRRLALDAGAAGEVTCPVGIPLGSALFVVGGAEVPVEVSELDGVAIAVDVVDCSVVARAPLP